MGRGESLGSGPRLSGAETPSAGDASTARLGESGSGLDGRSRTCVRLVVGSSHSGKFFGGGGVRTDGCPHRSITVYVMS